MEKHIEEIEQKLNLEKVSEIKIATLPPKFLWLYSVDIVKLIQFQEFFSICKIHFTISNILCFQRKTEQIKTDYEVMLDTQNKKYKRREKELVEQIDNYAKMTDAVQNFPEKPTMNAFEFEEMSEKLKSFERQNELLQTNKDALELQNKNLYKKLTDLETSYGFLQMQYNEMRINNRQPKWLKIKLGPNKTSPSGRVSTIADKYDDSVATKELPCCIQKEMNKSQSKIDKMEIEKFSQEKKSDHNNESKIPSETNSTGIIFSGRKSLFDDDEVRLMISEVQKTLKLKIRDQKLSFKLNSELKHKQKTISNDTGISSNLGESLHHCEKNFIQSQKLETEGHENLHDVCTNANLLDFFKICLTEIISNAKIDSGNDSDPNNEKIKKHPENVHDYNSKNLSDWEKICKGNVFKEKNKTDNIDEKLQQNKTKGNDTINKDKNITNFHEKNENLLGKSQKLKENHKKLQYSLGEKNRIILNMKIEKEIIEKNKNLYENMIYLINNQRTQLKNLCDIFTATEKLKNCSDEIETNNQVGHKDNIHQENHFAELKKNDYPLEIRMNRNEELFNTTINRLKGILLHFKTENEMLKNDISKMNVHMQEIKSEYVEYRKTIIDEFKKLETDFYITKQMYAYTMKLVSNENGEKKLLIQSREEEIDQLLEKNEKLGCSNRTYNEKKTENIFSLDHTSENTKWEETDRNTMKCEMRNKETKIMGFGKRIDRRKVNRTREYDSRRNINLNTIFCENGKFLEAILI